MDVFTMLQQATTIMCHELQDAYRLATPTRLAQVARAEILLAMLHVFDRALVEAAEVSAINPEVRTRILRETRQALARTCERARDKGDAYDYAAKQALTAALRALAIATGARKKETPECSPAF